MLLNIAFKFTNILDLPIPFDHTLSIINYNSLHVKHGQMSVNKNNLPKFPCDEAYYLATWLI